MKGKERIRAFVAGEAVDRLPYMPIVMSFAAQGIGAKYRNFTTDYQLIAEGQVVFAERFGADHVSVVTDPAVESADLGQPVIWYEDEPPANDESCSLLMDKSALARLKPVRPEDGRRMSNRINAVTALVDRVGKELMVEGWVEGPCAEASDLRGLSRLMMDFYDDPAFIRDLLSFTTALGVSFAKAQIVAGATIVAVGDAASSLMGPEIFAEFIHDHHLAYVDAIHAGGALARLHICGNTTALMPLLKDVPYDIIDLDHLASVSASRAALGPNRVLLGHLDTVAIMRDGNPELVRQALQHILDEAGGSNYIVSAGCEIPRDTPEANFQAMLDFARGTKPRRAGA